jgi:hypothetical protein
MIGAGVRRISVILLLVLGVQLWLVIGLGAWRPAELYAVAACALVALLPGVNRKVAAALERVRRPSAGVRRLVAVVIAVAATAYLYWTARRQGRDFVPLMHDEFSYLVQIHQLARGRLWMPEHKLADFFESIHLLVRPVYASKYFPGTALLYAPAVWLGLPVWVMPLACSGMAVGLVYRIIAELLDGLWAAVAALLIVATMRFRVVSIMIVAQPALSVMVLLMVWAWLRWRRGQKSGWVLLIGFLAGWAALIRPVDAVCYALPVGIAMSLAVWRVSATAWLRIAGLLVLGAAPFMCLQKFYNRGVTGSWLKTPWGEYARHSDPYDVWGFPAYDEAKKPLSPLPEKWRFAEEQTEREFREHGDVLNAWGRVRLPRLFANALPSVLLLALWPVGVMGLRERRWVPWAVLPLFVALYVPYTYFTVHYPVAVLPAVGFGIVLGGWVLEGTCQRWRELVTTFVASTVIMLALVNLPEAIRGRPDYLWQEGDPPEVRRVNEMLANLPTKPAVVLFPDDPRPGGHAAPVYNADVAWPDEAVVIRAHDLGERNGELFGYYGKIQPQRAIYRYDPAADKAEYLGTAREQAGYNR